jgi:hypothetical protein
MLSRKFDGKKFMWDGMEYEDEAAARQKLEEYASRGFEARMVEQEGKYYVFSRKVVTEIVIEGEPPI